MIICFTGVDGSGKTLQAQQLVARLNAAGYPAAYVWTGGRAYLTRPLIWVAKRLLRAPRLARQAGQDQHAAHTSTRAAYTSYLSSTRRLFRNPVLRRLWRHVSLLEHLAEILVAVLPHLLRRRIVVCDRYIYDSIIGTAVLADVDADTLPALLRIPRLYPVPRPTQWFLIDIPAAVAFARRDDVVDVAFLERRIPLYRAAASALGMQVVDGTGTPEAIAETVWERIQSLVRPARETVLAEQRGDA